MADSPVFGLLFFLVFREVADKSWTSRSSSTNFSDRPSLPDGAGWLTPMRVSESLARAGPP